MNNYNMLNTSRAPQNRQLRTPPKVAGYEGLEAQHFLNGDQKVRWLYEDSARKLHAGSPAPSTSSTASSSGFNSWASDQIVKDDGANVVQEAKTEEKIEPVIMYEGRDILDLSATLLDPRWNCRASDLPKDPQNFFNNRSQYSRAAGNHVPPHVDEVCKECAFVVSHFD